LPSDNAPACDPQRIWILARAVGRNEQKSNFARNEQAAKNLTQARKDLATAKAAKPSAARSEAIRKRNN